MILNFKIRFLFLRDRRDTKDMRDKRDEINLYSSYFNFGFFRQCPFRHVPNVLRVPHVPFKKLKV
jgi:hypothetical protein